MDTKLNREWTRINANKESIGRRADRPANLWQTAPRRALRIAADGCR